MPLTYWAIVGEGSVEDGITSSPLNTFFIKYLALIAGIIAAVIFSYFHVKNANFSKAKSYIIAGIFIIVLYTVKEYIFNIIFDTFQ
ncbi:hypothetical protein [Mucilaginibacter sp.]|uniref:hypothetical protein n=1 Tax=Mucilaginibacter sp. TaxID=1882438 RepID=UPI00326416A1